MENGITRRSAIKRMGAAVAGAAVLGTIPSFAREAIGPESFPQDSKPSDDPNASTLKMDYKLVYEGPDVVFHQINDHLWVGNGVLAGRREGEITSSGMGLNRRITYEGVRFNYNSQMVK